MTFSCDLCGASSNPGLAEFQEKYWREGHTCAPTSTSGVEPDFPVDIDTLRARANRFKAIPVPKLDPRELWGSPPLGGFTR